MSVMQTSMYVSIQIYLGNFSIRRKNPMDSANRVTRRYFRKDSVEAPEETRRRATVWPCASWRKHDPKGSMHPSVDGSTAYNSQDMGGT